MKLAPMIAALVAPSVAAIIARASASERRVWTLAESKPGRGQPNWLGSRRQQQPVEAQCRAVADRDRSSGRVDRVHSRSETKVDPVLAVEVLILERDPCFGGIARQIVLGKIGPVAWRGRVLAQHRQSAAIAETAKPFRRGESRRAAADDDDALRLFGRYVAYFSSGFELGSDEQALALDLDLPPGQGIEGRSLDRGAGPEAEAGMVPWTSYGLADDKAFRERGSVMCARGADGRPFVTAPEKKHRVIADAARQYSLQRSVDERDSFRKIGTVGLFGRRRHVVSLPVRESCEGHLPRFDVDRQKGFPDMPKGIGKAPSLTAREPRPRALACRNRSPSTRSVIPPGRSRNSSNCCAWARWGS